MKWDWTIESSQLDLPPTDYGFTDMPVRPVAAPGKIPLL
jgi:hypothetical protein